MCRHAKANGVWGLTVSYKVKQVFKPDMTPLTLIIIEELSAFESVSVLLWVHW